jgi:hypothetical protein
VTRGRSWWALHSVTERANATRADLLHAATRLVDTMFSKLDPDLWPEFGGRFHRPRNSGALAMDLQI